VGLEVGVRVGVGVRPHRDGQVAICREVVRVGLGVGSWGWFGCWGGDRGLGLGVGVRVRVRS
jgi:hypothetical protein